MNNTGLFTDEPQPEVTLIDLEQLYREELQMWHLSGLPHPDEVIGPNFNDLAAGHEALRRVLVEAGLITDEEFRISRLQIKIQTFAEMRKRAITDRKLQASKLVVPGLIKPN